MRVAAWVVALVVIAIGLTGIVSPASLENGRHHPMDIPGILYMTGPIRAAIGLVLFLFAPKSRSPRILRALGIILALQGIVPLFMGMDRGRTLLAQEELLGVAALRAGAVVALMTTCFIAFVVTPRRRVN